MKSLQVMLFLVPLACLPAQTPAPAQTAAPANPAAPKPPTVTLQPAAPVAASVPPDKVVLTIGDEKVTAGELDHLVDMIPEQYRAQMRSSGRRQFAENVIRLKVLAQEAKREKLDETPGFKDQVAFQREQLLAQTLYQHILANSKVDDAAAQTYYDAHKSDYLQVKASHILIRFKGSSVQLKPGQKDLTEEEALAKAQELKKKLVGGADFAALAKAESDDSQNAEKGGDLGTFGRGRMYPTFEQAAFTLPVGQISDPVKTPFGYHLIKVEERKEKTLGEVRPELEKKLPMEIAQKKLQDLQTGTAIVMDPEYFGSAPAAMAPPTLGPMPKPQATPNK
ncbi:MAG: peptidylprolyl isomerase [Bryobacteraceae bacterium]